jgi:hypothetical protein
VDEMRELLDANDRIYWRAFGAGGVPNFDLEQTEIAR